MTVDNTVPVTVNFTFGATNSAGADVTGDIDLTTLSTSGSSAGNLAYLRFSLAQLIRRYERRRRHVGRFRREAGSHRQRSLLRVRPDGMVGTATGDFSYTFPDNAVRLSDGYLDNVVTRAAIQVSGIPITTFTSDPYFNTSLRRPVANAVHDVVSGSAADRMAPDRGVSEEERRQHRIQHRILQQVPRSAGDPRRQPPRLQVLRGLPQRQDRSRLCKR